MIGNNVYGGGGNSNNLIPFQDNCKHLYMADKNSLNISGWKDLIGSIDINTPISINSDNSISLNSGYRIPFTDNFMKECFTCYFVCKRPSTYTNTGWEGVFNVVNVSAPTIDLATINLNWAIGSGMAGYDIVSTVNSKTYAVITIVNYYGYCKFYINNIYIGEASFYNLIQSYNRDLSNFLDIYCIALYDSSHYSSQISIIYQYLYDKYL